MAGTEYDAEDLADFNFDEEDDLASTRTFEEEARMMRARVVMSVLRSMSRVSLSQSKAAQFYIPNVAERRLCPRLVLWQR